MLRMRCGCALRAALGLVVSGGRHEIPHLVQRSGLSRQLVLGLLRSAGADIEWDGETVGFAGIQREYQALIAAKSASSSHLDDPVPAVLVERMRGILARVPPPIRGLDHVPATAETVLRRARYLARKFDLDQTRLLFIGDHDCTSLAFAVLGVTPRSVTVVDIDERLLAFIASQPKAAEGSITPLFADLRLGLPESARAAHDVAFTDPPYTADGVGLFIARGGGSGGTDQGTHSGGVWLFGVDTGAGAEGATRAHRSGAVVRGHLARL